jgi:hypothetical protein
MWGFIMQRLFVLPGFYFDLCLEFISDALEGYKTAMDKADLKLSDEVDSLPGFYKWAIGLPLYLISAIVVNILPLVVIFALINLLFGH